jgi:hypothetical protein
MLQLLQLTVHDVERRLETAVDLRAMEGTDVTSFSGYTVLTKIRRQENLVGGSRVRLRLRAPNGADVTMTAVYFGECATSGNAYDFSTTPTQLTFGGSASVTIPAKGIAVSDPIVFDFNVARHHIVAANVSSSTLRRFASKAGTRYVTSYYKAATSEAGTAAKSTDYTAVADTAYSVELIRVLHTAELPDITQETA